jgi:hypothetical protein
LRTDATNNKVRSTREISGQSTQEKIPAQID